MTTYKNPWVWLAFAIPIICADNDYVLDLRYQQIQTLQMEHLKNKTSYHTIELSNTGLEFMTPHLLENLKSLLELKVDRNPKFKIRKIEPFLHSKSLILFSGVSCGFDVIYAQSFKGLPSLETLDLSHNLIKSVDDKAFDSNQELKNVNLSKNALEFVHPDTFIQNKQLLTLDLSHNENLTATPGKPLISNTNLEVLYLTGCGLDVVEESTFMSLPNINELYLQSNSIVKIISEAFQLTPRLVNLSLENNQLEHISASIITDNMKNLCLDMNIFKLTRGYVKLYYKYERHGLIKDDNRTICKNRNETLKFEWLAMKYKVDVNQAGISNAFISTYLLAILLAEIVVLVALVICFMKLKKKFKPEDYSQTILNDSSIYKIFKYE